MMQFPEAESGTLELKRALPRNEQIVKTIIGFCNQRGGRLVLGVSDDRAIIGLDGEEIEELMEWLEQAVFQACSPPIIPRVYPQRYGDRSVLIIEVAEGMNKPYYRSSEGLSRGCYLRLGRSTVRATPELIEELRWQSQNIDFERMPVHHAGLDELNRDAFSQFLARRLNHGVGAEMENALQSYGLVTQEQTRRYPTAAGLLLFGRAPQQKFSEAMIICSDFKGRSGRDTIATVDCTGTLFEQFDRAYQFVVGRLQRSFAIKDVKRKERLEVPPVAIREALLNAIVHRNYHIPAPTKIAIYEDRIEVFSPGALPGPLNLANLRSGITYLRNPAICKAFREAGLVEKLGSGLIAILDSYEDWGLAEPSLIEGENYVKCLLPRTSSAPGGERDLLALIDQKREISVKDASHWLGVSRSTAQRRLQALIKSGDVIRTGQTRAIRYKRNPKVGDH